MLRTKHISIPVDLDDPHVAHLGPPLKPQRLRVEEHVGYSNKWELYNPEYWEPYHLEPFTRLESLSSTTSLEPPTLR